MRTGRCSSLPCRGVRFGTAERASRTVYILEIHMCMHMAGCIRIMAHAALQTCATKKP